MNERLMVQVPAHPLALRKVRGRLTGWLRVGRVFPLLFACLVHPGPGAHAAEPPAPVTAEHPLKFIDSGFENASPLWYALAEDGTVQLHFLYDHERDSPNRAAGHIHFQLLADPGAELTLEFKNLDNVWNGRHGSIARELKAVVVSENGRDWRPVSLESLPDDRVQLRLRMPGPRLFVARVEPYRLSDYDRLLERLRSHPLVEVSVIGRSVRGRDLEIVRLGNPDAPYRVFLRARAHPWESGGNWVIEGLINRLLRDDADAGRFLERYCVYLQPMANKDGVAMGRTRFNLNGKDLNRDWNEPANAELAPENAALEDWLERLIATGRKPQLALELHNDGNGRFHIARPPVPELEEHVRRMEVFESLLREHTWFTEGSTKSTYRNSGTLGEGWLQRYGINAAVHEFNCNWIAGLNQPPLAVNWRDYGAGLATVFYEYFDRVKP